MLHGRRENHFGMESWPRGVSASRRAAGCDGPSPGWDAGHRSSHAARLLYDPLANPFHQPWFPLFKRANGSAEMRMAICR